MSIVRRNVMGAVVVAFIGLACIGGWYGLPIAQAQEKTSPSAQSVKLRDETTVALPESDPQQSAVGTKLKALAYPGSKPESDAIEPWVGQTVAFTTDDLKTVEAWYRTKLGIDEAFVGGVANLPWPPGATVLVKERRQWSLARDDVRPRRDGSGNKIVRTGTVRNIVVRTPEGTLIVLLNRTPADAETMIALTYLPPDAKQ